MTQWQVGEALNWVRGMETSHMRAAVVHMDSLLVLLGRGELPGIEGARNTFC